MIDWMRTHPNLTAWAVLALGFAIILAASVPDSRLAPSQWLWLMVAAVATAGVCAWIISWEADEDDVAVDGDDAVPEAGASEAPAEEPDPEPLR
jgi:hypothetical protein